MFSCGTIYFSSSGSFGMVITDSLEATKPTKPKAMAIPLRFTTLTIPTQNKNKNHDAPTCSPLLFPPYPSKPIVNALRSKFRELSLAYAISPTAGTESSEVSEGNANLLDSVQVFDLNGNKIPISDLWKDRKAVVAFARHFGCVLCRKRADYLAAQKDKMDAAGVALILIGPGSVDQANSFAEQTNFEGEIYADPNHSSYEAFRFVSGVTTTFTPGAGLKIIQAYMEGYRQDWELSFEKETRTRGGWQQGGIIVAGPGEHNISFIHKDKEAGDDPDIEEILKACCS